MKRFGITALSLVSLLAASLWGQASLGTITGTVTDPQQAPATNIEITARNLGTNLAYKATTNDTGTYVILNLPIGEYEVTASGTGFKQSRRSNVTVEVAQRLRLDFVLEIGAVTDRVDVVAEIPRIQTEDSSLGTVIERKRIEELPLNGRHVFNLMKIVPGVVPRSNATDGFAEVNNQTFSQMRINGGPAYGNQFMLDGVSNAAAVHNEISVVPQSDSVEEFRVETSALKAEWGQTSGGVVNTVTKSGTNQFHGSLYEFLRNDALDARNAFSTQPDPRTGRLKQILRYNQYGGTVGGPVWIPKLYDGRNKTFFFAGYEQWRWRSTGAPRIATVATALQRSGDFSQTRGSNGALIPIYDPATTTAVASGGFSRQVFPGNVVPRARMDALSLRVLEYMPLPNATPTNEFTQQNNFVSLVGSPSDQGVFTSRIDHRFSERDSIFFRYSSNRNTLEQRGFGLGAADSAARNDQRDNHNAVFNYTRTLSSSVVNDFRMGVTRQWLPFRHPSFDEGWPQKLGFPSNIPQDQFPPVQIDGLMAISNPGFSGGLRAQQTVQIVDSVSWIKGKHSFKAGFDFRWWRLSFINRLNPSGRFDFGAALTNNPLAPAGTGFGLATYLLGEVSGGQLGIRPFFQFRANPFGTYIQDDWKITSRLTLNLGLRYDISFGPREMHNRYSNFDPFVANSSTGTNGVMTYAGAGGQPDTFINLDKNNFGPRVGFAWDPRGNGRTAIRGGYGLVYLMNESGSAVPDNANSFGFSTETPFVAPGGGPFKAFQFSQGPPNIIQPLGPSGGPNAFRGLDVRAQDRNQPTGYTQQWNLTIQHALKGGWTVSAAYAGSKGTKLFGGNYNLNQLDPAFFSQGLALQQLVPNPYAGQIRNGILAGATVQRSQLLRPFPDYNNVVTWANANLSSSYHSLQMTLEKRFSNGLSLLANYVKGKLITECFAFGGGNSGDGCAGEYRVGRFNRRLDRSIDQDDVAQRFVLSSNYELPIGKGKAVLTNINSFANALIGGWQINGIGTFQSGLPLAVRGTNNFTGIAYPDVLRDPTLPADERTPVRWFDTAAFANPANFTIGNAPRTLPRTRGPGLSEINFSIFKTFRFAERFRLETRVEMFNAINTVNYNAPNTTFQPNAQGVNQNANFGRILGALEPRRMQLGMRLTF